MKNTPKDPYTDRNTVAKTNERTALRNELREKAKHARAEMPAPYRAHKLSLIHISEPTRPY